MAKAKPAADKSPDKLHQELIEAAEEAIDNVFGDTSVSAAETRKSMEHLLSHINIKLSALDEDAGGDEE